MDVAENDSHYQENEALPVDGSRTLALGYGAVTAMRGSFVVGYFAGMKHVLKNQSVPPEPPQALEWNAGKRERSVRVLGTAYGISTGGTIVGRVGDNAFLARGDDSSRKRIRIDSLLRDSGWHIAVAYAIASSGRMLATGSHRGGPITLLVLDPA